MGISGPTSFPGGEWVYPGRGRGVLCPGGGSFQTWDTTGYSSQAGGTHPTECFLVFVLYRGEHPDFVLNDWMSTCC